MKNKNFLRILPVLFFVILSASAFPQDLIVTNTDDSINCKITKVRKDFIFYSYQYENKIRNTLLPEKQVKSYQYNYFPETNIPIEKIKEPEIYSSIRLAFDGGLSYRLAKISDDVPSVLHQYMKELKLGYHFGGDFTYYFSEQLGLGLKANFYRSGNEINNVSIVLSNGNITNVRSDDILIGFIGPSVNSRLLNLLKQSSFIFNLSIGYMTYKDYIFMISNYTVKGKTVGMNWDIGYDISIKKDFTIGFKISFILGILKQVEILNGNIRQTVKLDANNYENLSRIDLSIGIRILR